MIQGQRRSREPKAKTQSLHPLESEIQAGILHYLAFKGLVFWRQNLGGVVQSVGGRMIFKKNPMKGFPDLAGLLPSGAFFALEIKSATGKLSPEQKWWIEKLSASGAQVRVVRSVAEAKTFIEGLLEESPRGDL